MIQYDVYPTDFHGGFNVAQGPYRLIKFKI